MAAGFLFLLSFCGAYGQEQSPGVLLHAAQCLSTKQFLAPSKNTLLTFGYLLDSQSYSGEKVVYVVRYTSADRSHGEVFTVFVSGTDKEVFDIQNNATFVRTKSTVRFTGEALGGTWTHGQLVSAIKQIERKPRYEIPIRKLRPSSGIRCEAYTNRLR